MQHEPKASRRTKVKGKVGIYRRPTGVLEYCFTDSDGKLRWRTATTQTVRGAVAERGDVLARMHKGERVAPNRQTFAQVEALWRDQLDVADSTRSRYASLMDVHVIPYFGKRPIQTITTADVADFIVYLRPTLKGSTASVLIGVLGQVFAFAVRRGLVPSNPVRALERKERPRKGKRPKRILESDELARLLAHASDSTRLLLETMAWTGLRVSEALGLRWKDVDLANGFVVPRQQFRDAHGPAVDLKTEAGTGRSIVLAPQLALKLKAHRLASPWSQDDDLVFANASGKPRSSRGVLNALDLAANKAELNSGSQRKLTTHDLRHHFASVLIASGADVVHVSRQIGHASVAMTLDVYADEYAKVAHADKSREALSAAMEKSMESGIGRLVQM